MGKLTPEEFLATILVPEKKTEHLCWECKHLKPVLKGSRFPPADLVGWCTKIHWPFYWSITDFNVVKNCYAFQGSEKIVAEVAANRELAATLMDKHWLGLQLLVQLGPSAEVTATDLADTLGATLASVTETLDRLLRFDVVETHHGLFIRTERGSKVLQAIERTADARLQPVGSASRGSDGF